MLNNLFIFTVSLFLIIRGATFATKYSARLAGSFKLSKYTVGFMIISIISILPETFISLNSAIAGVPSFGLGMLFGSNIADLTLIFFILVLISGKPLKIESQILKENKLYPLLLLIPIVLGLNGHYSRLEGIALIIMGVVFYYMAFRSDNSVTEPIRGKKDRLRNTLGLLGGMALLLFGSHFIVSSASVLAKGLNISPVLIGMLIVGLGTTIPELFFSIKSIKSGEDGLAVGDILGTVLADATIVIGLIAVISPFSFPKKIIYVSGIFMVLASFILLQFMKSGRKLTKKEGYILLFFWLIFILTEFLLNT